MHVQLNMLPPELIDDVLRRERQRSEMEPLRPRLELPLPLPPREVIASRMIEKPAHQRGVVIIDLLG